METKIKVDETDVARISLGDSAMVEIDAFPDTSFVGRVVEISNSSIKLAAATGIASIYARDDDVVRRYSEAVRTGRILVNAPTAVGALGGRGADLLLDLSVERVHLGSVDPDRRDAVLDLDPHELAHVALLL